MNGRHVVLGANGGAGRAVVEALSARGTPVRAVSRSGQGDPLPGVEHVRGDVTDAPALRDACRNAAVVYHCVNVPYPQWHRFLMPIARSVTEAAAAAGARLVVMDNLYAYGPPAGPMTETSPRAAKGPKGRLRADLEAFYLEAHRQGRLRLAIGRASDFYGLTANSQVMILAVNPALSGRRAFWPGNLDAAHTLNYLPDVGRALATLGERDEALGSIWHLPADEPFTGRRFMDMVFQAIGRPMRLGVMSRRMMRFAGIFSPLVREAVEVMYQFERPFIMDSTKFLRTFGSQVTPHHEAVRQIVQAYR
jgi:nucleoside-diphosphate-sugar epimerase